MASHSPLDDLPNIDKALFNLPKEVQIPNQFSVHKAFMEFDDNGRMKPSAYYDRIVDVMEELVKFTYLTRGKTDWLTDRYSERKASADALSARVNQRSI